MCCINCKLCTCIESSEVVELSSASSSWLFFDKWGTFGLFGQIAGWEPTIIMEQGMCYGNCALHLMILLGMAVIGHKIVRAFSAPSILHPFINVWAVTSVAGASNPKDWILRIWKTRPAVSGLTILSILGMFIMVQLTYNNYRKSFEKCPERDFRQKWDECLDGMSALHFWIYCTRYGIFAIFTASLWVQNMGL